MVLFFMTKGALAFALCYFAVPTIRVALNSVFFVLVGWAEGGEDFGKVGVGRPVVAFGGKTMEKRYDVFGRVNFSFDQEFVDSFGDDGVGRHVVRCCGCDEDFTKSLILLN